MIILNLQKVKPTCFSSGTSYCSSSSSMILAGVLSILSSPSTWITVTLLASVFLPPLLSVSAAASLLSTSA